MSISQGFEASRRLLQAANDTVVADGTAETNAFLVTFLISLAVCLVFFLIFCFIHERFPYVYSPRTNEDAEDFPPLAKGKFNWISDLWNIEEVQIRTTAGVDSLITLRFFKMCAQMFACISVVGLIILIPINATGEGPEGEGGRVLQGFNRLMMSNIVNNSDRFWAHWLAIYGISAIALYFIRKNSLDYVNLRHSFMKSESVHNYVALVTDLPATIDTSAKLRKRMEGLFGEEVVGAYIVPDFKPRGENNLDKVVETIENYEIALEIAKAKFEEKPDEPPMHRTKLFGGEKVTSIPWYEAEIKRLTKIALEEQNSSTHKPTPSGFVVFKSRSSLNHTRTPLLTNPNEFQMHRAPTPEDVYWPNMTETHNRRAIRTIIIYIVIAFMVTLWTIPIGFVSALTSLEALATNPAFSFLIPVIESNAALKGFLQGFLPTLALIIFMALVPLFMRIFSQLQGIRSETALGRSVMAKVFLFEAFNIYLVGIVGRVLVDTILKIVKDPASLPSSPLLLEPFGPLGIMTVIGEALPKVSALFTNYVMVKGFGTFSGELLQIGPLIVKTLKLKFLAKTERARLMVIAPPPINLKESVYIARSMLAAVICLSFSTVNPIVLPFGTVYFTLGFFVMKHQLIFVYQKVADSGGLMWPRITNRLLAALLMYQATHLVYFSIRKAIAQAALVIPLIAITLYIVYYMRIKFELPALYLPRELVSTSEENKLEGGFVPNEETIKQYYKPSMRKQLLNLKELLALQQEDPSLKVNYMTPSAAHYFISPSDNKAHAKVIEETAPVAVEEIEMVPYVVPQPPPSKRIYNGVAMP